MEQIAWAHKLGADKYGRKIPVLACSNGEELAEFCTCGYSTQNQSATQKDLTRQKDCVTSVTTSNTQDPKKPHVTLEELLGQGDYANPVTTNISEKVIHLISKNKKVQQMLGLTPTKSMLEKNQVNGINDQTSENEIYSLTEKELSFLLDLLLTTKLGYSKNKIMDVLFAEGQPDAKVFSTSTTTTKQESFAESSATDAIKDLACSETISNLFKKHSPTCGVQSLIIREGEVEQYGAFNWRRTGVCASTYVNAIMRHLNAWRDGEDLDPESGFSHLAHIACSCNILMDAAKVGKLQDDRNKLPANGEAKEYSLRVGEFMSVGEFKDLIESVQKDLEDFGFELSIDDVPEPDTVAEYRILKEDERLRTGDEVYVGEGHWSPVYYEYWQTPAYVNNGTYRRKITNCDLKEKVADCDLKEEPKEYTVKTFPRQYDYLDEGEPIQQGDEYFSDVLKKWVPATLLFENVPSSLFYRRPIKSCCSKVESQLDRCKDCGKPLTYNWLMGFLCEDCELKFNDPYETH